MKASKDSKLSKTLICKIITNNENTHKHQTMVSKQTNLSFCGFSVVFLNSRKSSINSQTSITFYFK